MDTVRRKRPGIIIKLPNETHQLSNITESKNIGVVPSKGTVIYPQKTLSKFEIYPYICGLIVAH
jgi:hypothetical protein